MSVGERQRVEIVRCLLQDPRLLIMDEPTSVLTPQAVEKLFETLRRLAAEGCSILYISHKLDEIRALCHRATVLRAGRVTGDCDPRQETVDVARAHDDRRRPAASAAPRRRTRGDGALVVADLSLPADDPFGTDAARHQPRRCAPARSSASPACPATARRSCWPRCPASACSPTPHAIRIDGTPAGTLDAAQRRALGFALRARGAARPRRGAGDVARRERAPDRAPAGHGRARLRALRRRARLRAGDDRRVRRQGRRRRRPPRAACPAATCRSSSSAARSGSIRGC